MRLLDIDERARAARFVRTHLSRRFVASHAALRILLGAALGIAIYALGGARPQTPDIERFVAGECPAWDSPPLLARVRRGVSAAQPATESAS